MKKLISLLISLCVSTFANANERVFPISTEMHIGRIRSLIDRAPEGIYLTVGGERAFRGASMFEGIQHLIIVDISPTIIRYNKINIELLKAPNKEDYKHLRWKSSFSEWQKTSEGLTKEDFEWWHQNIRNMKGYDIPERLNKNGESNNYVKIRQKLMAVYPKVAKKFDNYEKVFLTHITWPEIEAYQKDSKDPLTKEEFENFDAERKMPHSCVKNFIDNPSTAVEWGHVIDYKAGNYLFDERLYQKLHNLVLENKITLLQADLAQVKDLDKVTAVLQKLEANLAILDLDNLYEYGYMGEEKFRIALNTLIKHGSQSSILILMNNYKSYGCAQFSIYVGFTFENISFWPKESFFGVLINNLPSDVYPLLDCKLYEGKDELPFYLRQK
jgi:hypothetical protein